MAHSHTRTLLAKLGFGDPDRRNSRHDAACNYIALGDGVLAKVVEAALGPGYRVTQAKGVIEQMIQKGEGQYATTIGWIDVAVTFTVEWSIKVRAPIAAPEPILSWHLMQAHEEEQRALHPVFSRFPGYGDVPDRLRDEYRNWRETVRLSGLAKVHALESERDKECAALIAKAAKVPASAQGTFDAMIEVKITRETSGNVIRQLKLYEEYHPMGSRKVEFARPEIWRWTEGSGLTLDEHHRLDHIGKSVEEALRTRCTKLKIAVLDYDVDESYRDALKAEGISVVRLGAGFDRYLEQQKASGKKAEVPEV